MKYIFPEVVSLQGSHNRAEDLEGGNQVLIDHFQELSMITRPKEAMIQGID